MSSTRQKGMLICFIGIDGSGKTTLAKYLENCLKEYGISCKYLWWFEAESSIFRRFLRLIVFRRGDREGMDNQRTKEKLIKNPLFSIASQYLILLGYMRQGILKVQIPRFFGKSIVCDRYIYDVIISFSIDFGYTKEKFHRMMNNLLRIFPKPDLVFLVDVPEEISYRRKNDTLYPELLSKQRTIYLELGKQKQYPYRTGTKMISLDGVEDLEELKYKVKREVLELLVEKKR